MDSREREQLIQSYDEGPEVLLNAWEKVPAECRQWRPSEQDWSAHEIVIHCADSEAYASIRIRLLASEPNPLIVGYDQEDWARKIRYHDRPVSLAWATIDAVRSGTVELIRTFEETTWQAVGTHTESGPYSAEDWLRTYATHLHDHAIQIQSNIERWRNSQ